MELLPQAHQEEDQQKSDLETTFQWALRVRNYDRLDQLFTEESGPFYTSKDSSGRNPFILACIRGDTDMVKYLLKHIEKRTF